MNLETKISTIDFTCGCGNMYTEADPVEFEEYINARNCEIYNKKYIYCNCKTDEKKSSIKINWKKPQKIL